MENFKLCLKKREDHYKKIRKTFRLASIRSRTTLKPVIVTGYLYPYYIRFIRKNLGIIPSKKFLFDDGLYYCEFLIPNNIIIK